MFVILQVPDRLVKVSRGMVENVLVLFENFYFLVDFIILDTQPFVNINAQIFVILGRPFLSTSNALINFQNGVMKLSFWEDEIGVEHLRCV